MIRGLNLNAQDVCALGSLWQQSHRCSYKNRKKMHGLVCIFCMGYWKRLGLASWQTSSSSSWSRSWQGMCPTCLFRSKQAILRCRDMTVAAIFLAQTLRAGVCLNRLGWDSWQTSCGSAWNRSWRVTWPASRRRTPRKPSGWPRQPLARPCCTP